MLWISLIHQGFEDQDTRDPDTTGTVYTADDPAAPDDSQYWKKKKEKKFLGGSLSWKTIDKVYIDGSCSSKH